MQYIYYGQCETLQGMKLVQHVSTVSMQYIVLMSKMKHLIKSSTADQ